MLKEGVHIHLYNGLTDNNRLLVSSGTEPCGEQIIDGVSYETDSFWPRGPWRALNTGESELVTGHNTAHFSQDVGIIKLPDTLINMAEVLGIKHIKAKDELLEIRKTKTEEYLAFSNELKKFVAAYTITKEKMHQIGWVVNNLTNRKTLTINPQSKKYLGLHMDSWEAIILSNLKKAPNRICINFGEEERFLLMINLTMEQVYDMVNKQGDIDFHSVSQDQLTIDFFRQFPEYKVIKIKINPYEAYIAPTENMIHDGNTEGIYSTDVHYTVRGFINLNPTYD